MTQKITILYCDTDHIVCIKPFGMLSEDGNAEKSVIPHLREYGKSTDGNETICPVHRLDRETGGLMVFARNSCAAAYLSRSIRDGNFEKIYTAKVCGHPEPADGEMEDLLFHDRQKNKSYVVKRERKGVRRAMLRYKTLCTDGDFSVVEVRLLTGRTHQIRVQFSYRGYPILGDRKYAGEKNDCMCLWSSSLAFPDNTGKLLHFSAPAPFFQ